MGTANVSEARVTRADAPKVLEFYDIRWELDPVGSGTRLTLWHGIDRRLIRVGHRGLAHWSGSPPSGSLRVRRLDAWLAATRCSSAAGSD